VARNSQGYASTGAVLKASADGCTTNVSVLAAGSLRVQAIVWCGNVSRIPTTLHYNARPQLVSVET
jgi:hypothetical protein